jgi:hypothetical protein
MSPALLDLQSDPEMPGLRHKLSAAAAVAVIACATASARADGAFPDSMSIFLPPDRPQEIVVAANFGLLVSRDGGARWHLMCEEAIATAGELVTMYQMGPPPTSTLYAVSANQLLASSDVCTWTEARGGWSNPLFTDVFPDPVDPARVFALAEVRAANMATSTLFESRDGGRTFPTALFRARGGLRLTGVESAAAAPRPLYVTQFGRGDAGLESWVARSADGGAMWSESSLSAALGEGEPRLAAIDRGDPRTLYLRVLDPSGDKLAISRDGGETVEVPLSIEDSMAGFLRRGDGTLLVTTRSGGGFRSTDGGKSFTPWPQALRLRGMGERGGVLYAVGEDAGDGFAVGASTDGGETWKALLRFEEICGLISCPGVDTLCAATWKRLMDTVGVKGCWGGVVDAGAAADARPEADAGAPGDAAAPAKPAAGGCSVAGLRGPAPVSVMVLAVLGVVLLRARLGRVGTT